MTMPQIRVLPTPQAVAQAAAREVLQAASAAIAQRGAFALSLAGGNTPSELYRVLADEPYLHQIDWSKVEIYFGDERCVAPEDPQSNFRMASETLLDVVPVPPANIHRIRGEAEPEAAAKDYGQMLKSRFGEGGVDLALLGMGQDGHTASLFPGSPALDEMHHRCVATYVDKLRMWRISMTAGFLNRSGLVLVLVTGQEKAATIQDVLESEPDPHRLPIQAINPPAGRMLWLLDAAAAGMQ